MNAHEWALVAFTILAQMSVGAFVILVSPIRAKAMRRCRPNKADQLSTRALLAIGPVMVLGLIASLFHLGNPFNAYLAVSNTAGSWLSREILFGVAFAGTGGLFAIMQWRKIGSFALRNAIAITAAIAGLTLVYAMSRVYMLPAQPSWNSLATTVAFFSTTFLLGNLAIGVAFVTNYGRLQRNSTTVSDTQTELLRDSLRWIALLSIAVLGVILVTVPLHIANLGRPAGGTGERGDAVPEVRDLLGLRLVLAFVGAGVTALFLYRNAATPGRERMLGRLAYMAFARAFVAEVVGRFLFYATLMNVAI